MNDNIKPRGIDGYNVSFVDYPPDVTERGRRWKALRSSLELLHRGQSEHPYLVIEVERAEDVQRARQAVYSWVHRMQAHGKYRIGHDTEKRVVVVSKV